MLVVVNDDFGFAGGWSFCLNNVSCLIFGKDYYFQLDGYNGIMGIFSMSLIDFGIVCLVVLMVIGGCGISYIVEFNGNGEWIYISDGSGWRIVLVNDMFNDLGIISVEYVVNGGVVCQDDEDYLLLDCDWFISVDNDDVVVVCLYLINQEL